MDCNELAETWINGNRSDVIEHLRRCRNKLAAAARALGVYRALPDASTRFDFYVAVIGRIAD